MWLLALSTGAVRGASCRVGSSRAAPTSLVDLQQATPGADTFLLPARQLVPGALALSGETARQTLLPGLVW